MLTFIKHHMEGIDGVAIYPIISLLIFFIFFVALFIWVGTAKKKYIEEVSNLPLESSTNNNLES